MPYFEFEDRNIFYIDEGTGTPLLLLPGNTASSAVHAAEIHFFSQSFRVVCPDYLGYGKSERVVDLPEDFWWYNARVCRALMENLDIDKYIVLGTSGGGTIALIMTILAPNSICCAIADSITGEFANEEELKKEVKLREKAADELLMFWQVAHGEDWQRVIEFDSKMILQLATSAQSIYRGRLQEIKCPVLLTGSLSDAAITNIETGLCSLARKINNSKVVLYSRGNHPLMWSRPEEFRREVTEFINNLRGPGLN